MTPKIFPGLATADELPPPCHVTYNVFQHPLAGVPILCWGYASSLSEVPQGKLESGQSQVGLLGWNIFFFFFFLFRNLPNLFGVLKIDGNLPEKSGVRELLAQAFRISNPVCDPVASQNSSNFKADCPS